MEDNMTKDGATRLAARLTLMYDYRVTFRVEQDKYGVWGVRSDMVRGIPRDGKGYYQGNRSGVRIDNRPNNKAIKRSLNGDHQIEDIPEAKSLWSKSRKDS